MNGHISESHCHIIREENVAALLHIIDNLLKLPATHCIFGFLTIAVTNDLQKIPQLSVYLLG